MIKPYDKQRIAVALQDYNKQLANYHFYNWEIAELDRCEKEIKNVIEEYSDNISDLIELVQEFGIQKFIPQELMVQIQAYGNTQQKSTNVFYSFDGQAFSTIEEAAERNEYLQYGMSDNRHSR